MRARTFLITLLTLCLLPAGTAAAASSKFTIRGAGFGHGVGMSQYGAYGYALNGASYRDILGHYYTGTAIGQANPGQRVRVLLQSVRGSASFTGATRAGARTLSARKIYYVREARGVGAAAQRPRPQARHLPRAAGHRPRRQGDAARDGRQRASQRRLPRRDGLQRRLVRGVNAVNSLPLDTYVRGVVGDESPPSWPLEALKAQAVAARTYALTTMKPTAGFDVYPDTRSQVYGGVAAEEASTDAAVAQTSGEVVTYNGQPVVTYFFSTSGGRTENVENTPLGNEPRPWLKSVDDPYDTMSPRHRWGPIKLSLKTAGRKLGGLVKGKFRGIQVVQRGVSPRIVEADVVGSKGRTRVTGGTLRARFGLYDTWAFFTSISSGEAPPPDDPTTPTTGGTDPFGSASNLRVRPVGALAGRVLPVLKGVRAQIQLRRGSTLGEGRRGARAARRPLLVRRYRAGRVPRPLPRRERPRRPRLLIRAVIFDCDGVLVDSEPISNRVLAGLLTEVGMPMTPEQSVEAFMGRSWKNVVAWADERGGLPDGFRRRYLDQMFAAFGEELQPVPGIVAALDAITLPNCVASSASIEKMRFTLGHTGLWDRFEGRIFSATEVEHGKPAPDLFLHAAASMGWEPGETAVVEDSPAGVAGRAGGRDDRVRLRGHDAGLTAGRRPRVHRHGGAAGAASAFVEPHERLRDADGLLAALVLEVEAERQLRAALDRLDAHDLRVHPDLAADRQRSREAHLVEPVVDAEREALELHDLLGELGREAERVVAVGDRAAERRLLRAVHVDVDPLVVAGDVGERVDVLLRDLVPVAGAELLALGLLELVKSGDRRAHGAAL